MTILGTIIVEPGTFDCLNLGDVAMLQVAICQLRALAPSAELRVLTQDPAALEEHCPGTQPLSADARREWFAERFFLGNAHALLPAGASRRLVNAQRNMRRRHPRFMNSAMRLRARMHRSHWQSMRAFLDVMERAGLVVIAGQHTIADAFYSRTRLLLEMLEAAIQRGIPTAMLGQGIGPLTDPELLARARDVLPSVGLIAVREPNVGPPVLRALGVSGDRVVVTGDAAVAPAFHARSRSRSSASRESLGVSLRVTPVAGVGMAIIERLRAPLTAFARAHRVPLIPLPSAFHGVAADEHTLRLLLGGEMDDDSDEWYVSTVSALIERVGRCRVVIAGAYHVAVFALAQGIPVVAMASSHYYRSKYSGLESLFGPGCETVMLDDPMLDVHLLDATERAWERADELRPGLLQAAERQVHASEAAFARAVSLVNPGEIQPRLG